MGIPYSREINAAFEEVTPVVAAGYRVLKTIKTIAILAAVLQVLTVILLTLILLSMGALILCTNPDLAKERQQLVTPIMSRLSGWVIQYGNTVKWIVIILLPIVSAASTLYIYRDTLAEYKILASVNHEGLEIDTSEAAKDAENKT